MARHLDGTVAAQYWDLVRPWALGAAAASGALLLGLWVEHRAARGVATGSIRRRVLLGAAFVTAASGAALAASDYMAALAAMNPYTKAVERNPLRPSVVIDGVGRFLTINARLAEEAASVSARADASPSPAVARPGAAACVSCPDMVIVHLESVFDPAILAEYETEPGYVERMAAGSPNASRSGRLAVNIFGGGSWISEFEVLCGVHHRVFDEGGIYPHAYLAGYVRSCLPAHLKRMGYETHAIYTASPFFAGVAAGFASYGIDRFADPSKIGAPAAWRDQRDEHFVGALKNLLARPSERPRFVFVSTNSNHGPHGEAFFRRMFDGPFDPDRARDPALRDYVNRLNDTFTTMLRLEHELRASGRDVAILFYGDHQPSFEKRYAASSRVRGTRTKHLTLFRMARTYGGTAPNGAPATTRIEDVGAEFLSFAGLPLSSTTGVVRALAARPCKGRQERCAPGTKRALRHLLMGGV
jgi:phosphoglycerol transferase MdoB-like AlkP superfamily enzyme